MNKNLAIAIGIVVVIVLAGVVMVPALFPPGTSMTVTFYDVEDNVVWSEKTDYGLFEFGFVTEAGAAVTKAVVAIYYAVEGVDAGNNVLVHCTFLIEAIPRAYMASPVGDETWSSPSQKTTLTGSWEHEFLLDFIGVTQSGKDVGWRINVEAVLNCRQYTSVGALVDTADPWSGTLGFNIDWDEPAAFAIVGSDFNFGPT